MVPKMHSNKILKLSCCSISFRLCKKFLSRLMSEFSSCAHYTILCLSVQKVLWINHLVSILAFQLTNIVYQISLSLYKISNLVSYNRYLK